VCACAYPYLNPNPNPNPDPGRALEEATRLERRRLDHEGTAWRALLTRRKAAVGVRLERLGDDCEAQWAMLAHLRKQVDATVEYQQGEEQSRNMKRFALEKENVKWDPGILTLTLTPTPTNPKGVVRFVRFSSMGHACGELMHAQGVKRKPSEHSSSTGVPRAGMNRMCPYLGPTRNLGPNPNSGGAASWRSRSARYRRISRRGSSSARRRGWSGSRSWTCAR